MAKTGKNPMEKLVGLTAREVAEFQMADGAVRLYMAAGAEYAVDSLRALAIAVERNDSAKPAPEGRAEGEMVERVARALCAAASAQYDDPPDDSCWDAYVDDARAAIEAMREPTEAMAAEYFNSATGERRQAGLKAWRAMIDAALAEP